MSDLNGWWPVSTRARMIIMMLLSGQMSVRLLAKAGGWGGWEQIGGGAN